MVYELNFHQRFAGFKRDKSGFYFEYFKSNGEFSRSPSFPSLKKAAGEADRLLVRDSQTVPDRGRRCKDLTAIGQEPLF